MTAKRQGRSGREKASGEGGRRKNGPSQAQPAKKRSGTSALPPELGQGGSAPSATERDSPAEAASGGFPVVGIGASAGGLEALQEFFGNMPVDAGAGFVVVTHQHPGHVSMLPALLARSTNMPVVEASDGLRVEPNHVYVGLPGGLLEIAGGVLHRVNADSATAPHLPIDHFFRSLGGDLRELAICVVLSGTGTDGTLGMRAVKAEAGMAMVQESQSAKYGGMPDRGWCFGHALLPSAEHPDELAFACACYAEDPERFRPFREATLGIRLRRGEGLPGTGLRQRQAGVDYRYAGRLDRAPCRFSRRTGHWHGRRLPRTGGRESGGRTGVFLRSGHSSR